MSTTSLDTPPLGVRRLSLRAAVRAPHLLGLAAILVLAAVLRLANLAALGYVNHYYSAGIASMLQSWQNFFFLAAEPGGAVSIDKPPVGLWLDAISVAVFGMNSFGLLLPQILSGLLSVAVLYHLVARRFGRGAGLLAALALAVTPVVVATDRNSTIDSMLTLALLLAAWAFLLATERGKLRWLLLGVVLVGIGFNIKMLQAFLPLPAFYALYLFGAKIGLWRKLAHLLLATLVLAAVSLSWAVAVDLVPASQRPYVGSSGDNSVVSLMLGYNGVERLTGMGGSAGGSFGGQRGTGAPGAGQQPAPNQQTRPGRQAAGGRGSFGGATNGQFQTNAAARGVSQTGQSGPLRLFVAPLSKEASWLLAMAILGGVLLLVHRPRWPLGAEHRALVLWGGWLLTCGVFFSIASFFHEYYLASLAAPLAALVGISGGLLWRMRSTRPWFAAGVLLLAGAATLAMQLATAQVFVGWVWWLWPGVVLFLAGCAVLAGALWRERQRLAGFGLVAALAGLLVLPTAWSALTMLNPSVNQSLPSAYSGAASTPLNGGGVQVDTGLLDFLQANTAANAYLLAVPSSMQGSDYVLATGRPVLYLGGFMGQDSVASTDDLAQMVASGELRYIYWDASGRSGIGGSSALSGWITSSCSVVAGYETTASNMGSPGGTSRGVTVEGGSLNLSLYDCSAG